MSTSLYAALKYLRTNILDDTGGTGVAWDQIAETDPSASQLRWKNEELTNYINEALIKAFRGSLLKKDFNSMFNISIVAGTSTYTIDSRILQILDNQLVSTGKELSPMSTEDLFKIPNWDTNAKTPTHYIPDELTDSIFIYPQPVINDTLKLVVYRLPLNTLSWTNAFTAQSTILEIKDSYVISLLNGAASLAYLKDEANTYDPQRSALFKQLFENEFEVSSVYSDTKKLRTPKNSIDYGGIKIN